MSRVSPWQRVWRNFWASISREDAATRKYVGEDIYGNKFYELDRQGKTTSNVNRGFEQGNPNNPPSFEWQSWLKGTRRFPPSDEEVALNQARREQIQQGEHSQDAETEKRAPHVASRGQGAADLDRKHNFPTYDDIELAPGAERRDDKGKRRDQ
ncbi:unnamed protein product [Bursaphelenchus xylophilus]|uniref:(pine wood nematode) hypothetical protein n=1 Tax=Bursaphelenchus xylophilus TaxID=6326 RepID=A0A1I7RH31_BURXY|nr:unnamed protein product [Bursaphelenchus xylophilus]CAG9115995.1 unnamed protein product [Bursaphelenchus xylophilus]